MPRPVRIPSQVPEEWSNSTRAEFAAVDGAARHRLHLPSVIARHPTFLPPYMTWAKAVALRGVLERRDNSLLALRTGFLCSSEFEWGVHADSGVQRAGLTSDEVARVAVGPNAPEWSDRERALLRAADDLQLEHTISDATWDALSAYFGAAALIEVVFVCGHYTMLSMVANAVGVAPEDGWLPLPGGTR